MMDKNLATQLRPLDFKGKSGTLLRGNNVYPGGMPNATSGPIKRVPRKKKAVVPKPEIIQSYLLRK